MKKFIKALEDNGIMKRIVDSAVITEKITGEPVSIGGLEMILDFHMTIDEDLEDIFLQEAHAIAVKSIFKYVQEQILERQKAEYVADIDMENLFKKMTGQKEAEEPVKKPEVPNDLEKKIEEMVLGSLQDVVKELFTDMMKPMFDDCK